MILINLLPHREAAREIRKKTFYSQLGLTALLGAVICGAVFMWYQGQLEQQQSRNTLLRERTKLLDEEIKDIASLQAEIASLRARQIAVEKLQSDRNMPVHLLDELVSHLPDGIYLRTMKQEGQSVLLSGSAQSQERVSELLRKLSAEEAWLSKPELVEIVAGSVELSKSEKRRIFNFTIRVALNRPSSPEAEKASVSPPIPAAPGKV